MSHKCGGPSCYRTQGRRSECPSCSSRIRRLRRVSEALPKTGYGESYLQRHPDVKSEWIAEVLESPSKEEMVSHGEGENAEPRSIVVGRARGSTQWIAVVFVGHDPETRRFLTAYKDRRYEEDFGGRPWPTS